MIPSRGAGTAGDDAAGVESVRLARATGRDANTLPEASPYRAGMRGDHARTVLTEQTDVAERREIAASHTVRDPGPYNRHAGGYNGFESGAGAAIHCSCVLVFLFDFF
jgi:hypothetical protein